MFASPCHRNIEESALLFDFGRGAPRIHGELLKLEINVGQTSGSALARARLYLKLGFTFYLVR
jgi:hypothetical protein